MASKMACLFCVALLGVATVIAQETTVEGEASAFGAVPQPASEGVLRANVAPLGAATVVEPTPEFDDSTRGTNAFNLEPTPIPEADEDSRTLPTPAPAVDPRLRPARGIAGIGPSLRPQPRTFDPSAELPTRARFSLCESPSVGGLLLFDSLTGNTWLFSKEQVAWVPVRMIGVPGSTVSNHSHDDAESNWYE